MEADYSDCSPFLKFTNYSSPEIKILSWAAKTMNSEMHKFNLELNRVDEDISSTN